MFAPTASTHPVRPSRLNVRSVPSPLTRTVDIAIARLRRKIEPDPHHPRFLRTAHRDGYSLMLG